MHSINVGTNGSMSKLPIVDAALAIVSEDFSLTSSLMSTMTCAISGTNSGNAAATDFGAAPTKKSMTLNAAILACQNGLAKPAKIAFWHALMANGDNLDKMASTAGSAASLTSLDLLSPAKIIATSNNSIMNGSS